MPSASPRTAGTSPRCGRLTGPISRRCSGARPGPALRGGDDRPAGRLPALPPGFVRGRTRERRGFQLRRWSPHRRLHPRDRLPSRPDRRHRGLGRALLGSARRKSLPAVLALLPGERDGGGEHAAEGRDPKAQRGGRPSELPPGRLGELSGEDRPVRQLRPGELPSRTQRLGAGGRQLLHLRRQPRGAADAPAGVAAVAAPGPVFGFQEHQGPPSRPDPARDTG